MTRGFCYAWGRLSDGGWVKRGETRWILWARSLSLLEDPETSGAQSLQPWLEQELILSS
jgi:hypothetical protein